MDKQQQPQQPVGELIAELSKSSRELIRDELRLTRAELRKSVSEAKQSAIWMTAALIPALMALVLTPFIISALLARVMPNWAAGLVTVSGLLVLSAILGMMGWTRAKKAKHVTTQAGERIQEDQKWLTKKLN